MQNTAIIVGKLVSDVKKMNDYYYNLSLFTEVSLKCGTRITEYFLIELHGDTGRKIQEMYSKGDTVYVVGHVHTETWEEEHKEYPIKIRRYKTKIKANYIRNLSLKGRKKQIDPPTFEELEELINEKLNNKLND